MSKIRFSDSMEIVTSGPLHLVHKSDGFYVAGEGFLCPVESIGEGLKVIRELKKKK